MVPIVPDWLSRHGGSIRLDPSGKSWTVLIDNSPRYSVKPIPAEGAYACNVIQSVDGRRLEKMASYASVDLAVNGGLEDLRTALGW